VSSLGTCLRSPIAGEAQVREAGAEGASCVDPVFEPMQLAGTSSSTIGLAEGPLLSLMTARVAERAGLVDQIFTPGNAGRLSSGHRAVAEQVAPLMAGLSQYYKGRAAGASAEMTASAATQLNGGIGNVPNYSPTAFMVSAMQDVPARKLDYVATVVFVDREADVLKAKKLAMAPGSSLPR
jgi:hypothetical protein